MGMFRTQSSFLRAIILLLSINFLFYNSTWADEEEATGIATQNQCNEGSLTGRRLYIQLLHSAQQCLETQANTQTSGVTPEEGSSDAFCLSVLGTLGATGSAVTGFLGTRAQRLLRAAINSRLARRVTTMMGGRPPRRRTTSTGPSFFDRPSVRTGIVTAALFSGAGLLEEHRENLSGTPLAGGETICGQGSPYPVRPLEGGGCELDTNNIDAIVQLLSNEEQMRALATTTADFCEHLDNLIVDLYQNVINRNPLFAGDIQVVGRPTCRGNTTAYYLESTRNGVAQTFFVVQDGNQHTMTIDDTANSMFDRMSFDYTDGEIRSPLSTTLAGSETPISIDVAGANANEAYRQIDGYADSIAHLHRAWFGPAVQRCCNSSTRCESLGINTAQQPRTPISDPSRGAASTQ